MVVNRPSHGHMSNETAKTFDERYVTAIRRRIFDKVPLSRAMREAGFSASYSNRCKSDLMKVSKPFSAAWRLVEAEQRARKFEGHSKDFSSANMAGEQDPIKALVIDKMVENVQKGVDGGVRSARLIGDLKDRDWFVNKGGDMQLGVFAVLNDPKSRESIERMGKALEDYQDCSWCGEQNVGSSEDLQKHSLVCPKRPISVEGLA